MIDPISVSSLALKAAIAIATDVGTWKTAAVIICAAVVFIVSLLVLYMRHLTGNAAHDKEE